MLLLHVPVNWNDCYIPRHWTSKNTMALQWYLHTKTWYFLFFFCKYCMLMHMWCRAESTWPSVLEHMHKSYSSFDPFHISHFALSPKTCINSLLCTHLVFLLNCRVPPVCAVCMLGISHWTVFLMCTHWVFVCLLRLFYPHSHTLPSVQHACIFIPPFLHIFFFKPLLILQRPVHPLTPLYLYLSPPGTFPLSIQSRGEHHLSLTPYTPTLSAHKKKKLLKNSITAAESNGMSMEGCIA